MAPPFTDDEYRLFAEWLAQEFGLRFGPERREILRARLDTRRVELNLPTFERLLFHVRHHPAGHEERLRLLSNLTNNESYFFRERAQLDLLAQDVLPAMGLEAGRQGRPVRMLSAGCAAGEEAYTLAILGREALGPGRVSVTGVDLDSAAIARATEALYRPHAFRGVDDEFRDRYFNEESGSWRLEQRIRATARFRQGNLVDPDWAEGVEPQDVVFCRNVMIYFDDAGIRRAVDSLYEVVRPGGCLFLGHAETLSRIPTRFTAERRPGAVFYRRPEE